MARLKKEHDVTLQAELFKDDRRLEKCLVDDSAHLTLGVAGDQVSKVQQAVLALDDAGIANAELAAMQYGHSTAAAVLAYKRHRSIINEKYQRKADDIVGKMTIAALDEEVAKRPQSDPLTGTGESARILQLLARKRLIALLMIQTTLKSLAEVQTAFTIAETDPESAAGLFFVNRFAIDGLNRFFAVGPNNHRAFLPRINGNFQRYLDVFPRLAGDQGAADYGFLLRHATFQAADRTFFLTRGKITAATPPAFSSPSNPKKMLFTPRYRERDSTQEPLFQGFFERAVVGIQIHEMGHFYFNFLDGSPRGQTPERCLRLAPSYDLLARQVTFKIIDPL
jgi:hypothetical protein